MNLLIIAFFQFIGAVIFLLYGAFLIIQLVNKKRDLISIDTKMLYLGQILTWVGTIGIIAIGRNFEDKGIYYLIALVVLFIIFVAGSRFYVISYKVKEENKNTVYYDFDKWLEKEYRKYLAPLWKDE